MELLGIANDELKSGQARCYHDENRSQVVLKLSDWHLLPLSRDCGLIVNLGPLERGIDLLVDRHKTLHAHYPAESPLHDVCGVEFSNAPALFYETQPWHLFVSQVRSKYFCCDQLDLRLKRYQKCGPSQIFREAAGLDT